MVLVGSNRFEALARQVARALGADWLPTVVVEHPIGGRSIDDLRELCDDAWVGLQALLAGVSERGEISGVVPTAQSESQGSSATSSRTTDERGEDHSAAIVAAMARLQGMIGDEYHLVLAQGQDDAYTLQVIPDNTACPECLVPDALLVSILTDEVRKAGGSLRSVRVEHSRPD